MECPVCAEELSLSRIEEHVDKCLQLRNPPPSEAPNNTKRPYPFFTESTSNLPKRQKIYSDPGSTSSNASKSDPTVAETKRKSSFEAFGRRTAAQKIKEHVPLAESLRPKSLDAYVGQEQLVGEKTILGRMLRNGGVTNMILWGPPGCGKTSLANVIARSIKKNCKESAKFIKLSATTSGIGDIRETVGAALKDAKLGIPTIVFMDEIHRFNKLQQDIFLPHVEAGTFVLIGATTENPSYALNSALLSRCRVFPLERLTKNESLLILARGIASLNGSIEKSKICTKNLIPQDFCSFPENPSFFIDEQALRWLANTAYGDARVALGGLEIAFQAKISGRGEFSGKKIPKLAIGDLKNGLEQVHTLFGGKCELKYDLINAMHKSIRAGRASAALYWLARLMACGEDPVYIGKRLVRIASEEIGLQDPKALNIAVQAMQASKMIGMPECDVMLGQSVVYMARASKSQLIVEALRKSQKTVIEHKGPQPSVPLHIRCRAGEGKLQANLGPSRVHLLRKKEDSRHFLPAGLENSNFFY